MCSSRAEWYLVLLALGCVLMSLTTLVPMFVLTHPGDECLLFISVRGEALIYGNPAGCHFLAYGHCVEILGVFVLLGLLFLRRKKGFVKIERTTHPFQNGEGKLGLLPSPSMTTIQKKQFARLYSTKVILLCSFLTSFSLMAAFVIVCGYIVSCDELHYETRRQLYGRTTLGTPLRNFNIACYSLFRDVDFHSRFHFDHYEYSGQWHGQYRGYQHGKVHQMETKHEHLIGVALALEMAVGGAFVSAALWCLLLAMLIYLRCMQKRRQNRELAETMEDARIYASNMEQMHIDQMQMKPLEQQQQQLDITQPSIGMSEKPTFASTRPSSRAATPNSIKKYPLLDTSIISDQKQQSVQPQQQQQQMQQQQFVPQQQQFVPQQQQQFVPQQQQFVPQQFVPQQQQFAPQQNIPLVQQQFSPQQQIIQQQQQQANGVQYVQLSNGLLVPITSFQLQQQQRQLELQQQQMQQLLHQHQRIANHTYAELQPIGPPPPQQQQVQIPQIQITQPQVQFQIPPQQQVVNSNIAPKSPNLQRNNSATINIAMKKRPKSDDMEDGRSAQRKQVEFSNDAGLKCSQI